ncbi:MAG: hypothetical protein ACLFO1_07045 [Spirochaetaceae bacterium]
MLETVTTIPAPIMHLADYGLAPGSRANLAIFDVPGATEVLRVCALRRITIRDGVVKQRRVT